MPVPVPTPAVDEVQIVSEIVLETYETTESAIDGQSTQAIADAKWALTLDDVDAWAAIETETGDVKRVGEIEFFQGTAPETRLDFRNKVRQRYGFSALTSERVPAGVEVASLPWF
jgi:hypothetical protein